jgi:hypothetical protein
MEKTNSIVKSAGLIFLLALSMGCGGRLIDPSAVKAVTIVWIPAHGLRNAPLEFTVDDALVALFISRLNESKAIDPLWKTDSPLYEGRYEFSIMFKDGREDRYRLDGDSVVLRVADKSYSQNKDLHLFIYQNLFLEFIKRKIKIP